MTAVSAVSNHVAEFSEQGYTILRGAITGAELAALQAEAKGQLDAGPEREPAADFPFKNGHWWRVNAMARKPLVNNSVLAVVAHPFISEVLDGILGLAVFGDDALVFKADDGGAEVQIHSAHRDNEGQAWTPDLDVVNVGVYLDAATPENGCLRLRPGSHRLDPELARSYTEMNMAMPGLIDVITEPGDVVLHNEWILHGSEATPPSPEQRRILYLANVSLERMSAGGRGPAARYLRRMTLAGEVRSLMPYAADEPPRRLVVPDGWETEVAAVTDEEMDEIVSLLTSTVDQ